MTLAPDLPDGLGGIYLSESSTTAADAAGTVTTH